MTTTLTHDDDIVKGEEEELIFDPFNSLNTEITLSVVQSILTKYDLGKVHNLNLYKRAFIINHMLKDPN